MEHGKVTPQIAEGLLRLKQRIAVANIPSSRIDETLNLATWNIRDFGKTPRTDAAIHYIAEILGQFDLVSIVELRADLGDLKRVMAILGSDWRVVYSGVVPDPGGNGERSAYLYDRRAVVFNGLAAVAIPPRRKIGSEYLPDQMWWRLPYLAAFRSGNFDFIMISVHIRWGGTIAERRAELALLAQWIETFRESEQGIDRDVIVVGDFNIPHCDHPLFKAVSEYGLQCPKALLGEDLGSNLAKNKRYDQILQHPSAIYPNSFADQGGVLDFHIDEAHIAELFPAENDLPMTLLRYTHQMSDHLPLWIQIRTDNDAAQLEQLIQSIA